MRLFLSLIISSVFVFEIALAKQDFHYQILETTAHDSSYFTQGLELSDGLLFESSGLYGKSRIRKYHPDTGTEVSQTRLPDKYFAEGLTLLADELFLLTWKENTLFVLNPEDLAIVRQVSYSGEGWGLANNGRQLIMSNGSKVITFRNAATFEIERELIAYSKQHSVKRINELEYAEGLIWANIWLSPLIVQIDPQTGELAGFYDLTDLVVKNAKGNRDRVLNGIAYDADKKAFWITGKLWPERYLIKFGQPRKIQ